MKILSRVNIFISYRFIVSLFKLVKYILLNDIIEFY